MKSKNNKNKQNSNSSYTNTNNKNEAKILLNSFSNFIGSFSLQKKSKIKLLQILFIFCCASFLSTTNSTTKTRAKKHFCGTDLLKAPKRILVPEEPLPLNSLAAKRIAASEPQKWELLRIHFDFSYIEQKAAEGLITQKDVEDLKNKIIPKAKSVFEGFLRVKRIKTKHLKLNSPHCETFPIPNLYNHAGDGVAADIVIFVLIDTSGYFSENGIEAAAIHCLQHQETRRPIAGYIQFKSDLNVNSQNSKDYYAWLAIHEISHILVINRALYEDFIDPETLAPLGYERVIGSKVLESGSKMNYIKTPKVLEKAKAHFGCAKLSGLPLEYNGGPGTAGSHWAKRYMNGDYMIGESFGENLISEISLALFEDSGWYKVNWEMANLFLWGKGKGCEFFDREKKCVYAEKFELDVLKLNSTLVEFASNEQLLNNSRSKDSVDKISFSEDYFSVKNDIFKNVATKQRLSLKVLKKKATAKIKGMKLKQKAFNNLNKNTTYNENIDNDTIKANSTENNTEPKNNNNHNYKDSAYNSILKVFGIYTSLENSTNVKKYILQYKTNFKDEFCTDFNMPVCSTSHLFRGSCTVEDPSEPIEKHEMFFKNSKISGSEKLTDRCPTAIESRYKQASYGGSCRYGEKFPHTKTFEKICPECACFMSNLREKEKKNQMKKNFRVNNNINNKNKLNNSDHRNKKKSDSYVNLNSEAYGNISKAENFLKEQKDNAQYQKITKISNNKLSNQINYSFKELYASPKNNSLADKNTKESNEDQEQEEDENREEYEIIKLNPTLQPEDFVASCFEFKCEKGELFLFLKESKFKCEEDGKITEIPGYEGGIRCPSKSILCDEKYLCKFGCVERFNNSIAWEKFDEENK